MKGIPKDFAFGEIQPDWDRMMPFIETAMERVPALQTAGLRKLFCGPESFTPDMTMLLGEAPELKNFYVGAGMNSLAFYWAVVWDKCWLNGSLMASHLWM